MRPLGGRPPLFYSVLAAWLSGSALVSMNEVTLRRARLILGWVTVCGRVNQLSLLASTYVGCGVKASVVYSTSG